MPLVGEIKQEIQQFNSWLTTAVPSYGSQFHLVDTYDSFISPDGTINSSLFVDGIHPTAAGVSGQLSGYEDLGNDLTLPSKPMWCPSPALFPYSLRGFF